VVTTERNNPGKSLASFRHALHLAIGRRLSHEDTIMAILDLFDSESIIVRGHRNVTTVNDCRPAVERVGCERDVIASIKIESARTLTNAVRSKACTGTVRCTGVERSAYSLLTSS
jgi:hypothetical protein